MTLRAGPLRPVLQLLFVGTCLGAAAGASCGGDDTDALRRRVLHHLGHAVAGPAFEAFERAAQAAALRTDALCDAPSDAALADARAAWSAGRDAWSRTLPFGFGPLAEQMQPGPLDFWPARPDTIEAAIAGAPAAIDATYLASKGTSAKGMPALEYLLFGTDPAAVLPALTDPTGGARRCAYARVVAEDIAARATAVHDAWSPGFADALARAGDGSPVYASAQAGVDEVVNKLIDGLAVMVKTKLDTPLGNLTGAAVDPALLESRFSGRARADLAANLEGVWAVYHGADPVGVAEGLGVLVHDVDPGLNQRVHVQYESAAAAVAAIPEPLADALTTDREAVQFARDELDALRRMLKLDVASALGVTLMLSDNDGD